MKAGMLEKGTSCPFFRTEWFFVSESQSRHHSLKITKTAPTIMPNPTR